MPTEKLFIPVLLGTVREGRYSQQVAEHVFKRMQEHPQIETQLLDPRQMNLPNDNEGEDLKFLNPDYRNAVVRADGLVVVTPEYNHGYPGTLKRVLDMLLGEYIHKAVGVTAVSKGGFGGTRVIESLTHVFRELGLVMTFADLQVSKVRELFDENGQPKDEKFDSRIDSFLEELIWMSQVLKWGRENVPSKYDQEQKELDQEWAEKSRSA